MYENMKRELEGSLSTTRATLRDNIMIICGETDSIIVSSELKEDAADAFGGLDKLTFKTIDAGHDFPIVKSGAVIDLVLDFWGHSTSGSSETKARPMEKPS